MVDMLKPGMCRDVRRNHGSTLMGRVHFFWSGSRLILVIIVVALPTEIFRSFMLMRRAKLRQRQHKGLLRDGQNIRIDIGPMSHSYHMMKIRRVSYCAQK